MTPVLVDSLECNPSPRSCADSVVAVMLGLQVIKAVMDKNLASLVRSRPLKSWRETLALLCTYACSDEWGDLCSTLGMHLARNGHTHAAVLCYICAGNVDEAVKLWCSAMGASFAVDVLQVRPADATKSLTKVVCKWI